MSRECVFENVGTVFFFSFEILREDLWNSEIWATFKLFGGQCQSAFLTVDGEILGPFTADG